MTRNYESVVVCDYCHPRYMVRYTNISKFVITTTISSSHICINWNPTALEFFIVPTPVIILGFFFLPAHGRGIQYPHRGFYQGGHYKLPYLSLNVCTLALSFSRIPVHVELYVNYGPVYNLATHYLLQYSLVKIYIHIYSTYNLFLELMWISLFPLLWY